MNFFYDMFCHNLYLHGGGCYNSFLSFGAFQFCITLNSYLVAFLYLQIVNCFVLDKKYPFQFSPFVNVNLIRLFSKYLSCVKLLEYVLLTTYTILFVHI